MSNAKKLSYEMKEPAFLARLRANAAGTAHQPERYIAPRNRKIAVEDGDDTPQYVLEDGSVIGKEEFARLERGEESAWKGKEEGDEDTEGRATSGMEKGGEEVPAVSSVTDVGGKRKRKAVKIVGGDGEDGGSAKDKPREGGKIKATGKRKQRVKLSFEDE